MMAENASVIMDAQWNPKALDCDRGRVAEKSIKRGTENSDSHEFRIHTFYFWDLCRWQKVPVTTNKLLFDAYKTGKGKIVVAAGMGQLYEIDFENKLQKNMKTGYFQSLAWECHTTGSRVGFDTPINGEKQEPVPGQDFACIRLMTSPTSERSFDIYDSETPLETSSSDSPKTREFFHKLGKKVACLEPDGTEFSAVELLFNKGCSWQVQPKVKAVHKVLNSEVKKRAFADQVCEMERSRGNARLQYAWFKATADEVFSVVMYGFSQSSKSDGAGRAYGNGIYLTPCNQTHRSARQAAKDRNKEHHLILCEVILGESEVVPLGSQASLPSSLRFDSGTDSSAHPSTYVIWFPFSNSHIIPWYVVSFTAEAVQQEERPARVLRRVNSNRTTPYPRLQVPNRDAKVVEKLFHPSDPRTPSKLQWLNILAGPTAPTGGLPPLTSPSAVLQRDLNVLSMLSPSPTAASGANTVGTSCSGSSTRALEEDDASSEHGPADKSDHTSSSSSTEVGNYCPQNRKFGCCGVSKSKTLIAHP